MTAAHTPGKWTAITDYKHGPIVENPEGTIVADYTCWTRDDHDEAVANARLIASAPDLLEAAVRSEEAAQERHDFDDLEACAMVDKAYEPEYLRRGALRAAIKKAMGA